jgi:hypothetical protein
MKEFKIRLQEDDPVYKNNYKQFDIAYNTYCDKMHEKYKNDLSNHYLRSLFTYKIEDLNKRIHESLKNYSNEEVKCEVERIINSPMEDKPNHVLTKFFNKKCVL